MTPDWSGPVVRAVDTRLVLTTRSNACVLVHRDTLRLPIVLELSGASAVDASGRSFTVARAARDEPAVRSVILADLADLADAPAALREAGVRTDGPPIDRGNGAAVAMVEAPDTGRDGLFQPDAGGA